MKKVLISSVVVLALAGGGSIALQKSSPLSSDSPVATGNGNCTLANGMVQACPHTALTPTAVPVNTLPMATQSITQTPSDPTPANDSASANQQTAPTIDNTQPDPAAIAPNTPNPPVETSPGIYQFTMTPTEPN